MQRHVYTAIRRQNHCSQVTYSSQCECFAVCLIATDVQPEASVGEASQLYSSTVVCRLLVGGVLRVFLGRRWDFRSSVNASLPV